MGKQLFFPQIDEYPSFMRYTNRRLESDNLKFYMGLMKVDFVTGCYMFLHRFLNEFF